MTGKSVLDKKYWQARPKLFRQVARPKKVAAATKRPKYPRWFRRAFKGQKNIKGKLGPALAKMEKIMGGAFPIDPKEL